MRRVLGGWRPDTIVNAAAYTAVDRAESEPELALAVNGAAPAAMGWVVDSMRPWVARPDAAIVEGWLRLLARVGVGAVTYLAALAAVGAPQLSGLRAVGARRPPDTLDDDSQGD